MKFGKALFVFWLMYFTTSHGHKCWAADALTPNSPEVKKFRAGLDEQSKLYQKQRDRARKNDEERFKERYGDRPLYGAMLEAKKTPPAKKGAKKDSVRTPSSK